MAFTIAPANSGSELGMAQMRYGLHNSANYNASNLYTAAATGMQELANSPATYQASLSSKTWDGNSPYGFDEMYGETWDSTFTLSFNQAINTDCSTYQGTVKVNGGTEVSFSKLSGSPGSPSSDSVQVSAGDTILISVTAQVPTGAGCAGFFGSDVTIKTGPNAGSLTTRKVISSPNTDTYSYTASTSEAYISITSVATS